MGSNHTFGEASILLEELTAGSLSAKQIERLCHYYGEQLERSPLQRQATQTGRIEYVIVDGSYLLTRQEGWKETKVGRVFQQQDNFSISEHRQLIYQSDYLAHLGGHQEFINKFEGLIDESARLVFVADGAPWIWPPWNGIG